MQSNVDKKQRKRLVCDLVLTLSLLVVSLSAFLIFKLCSPIGETVEVKIDGELVAEYPLSVDGVFTINGGTNILVIESGEAYIREASCPDGLCVGHGRISRKGESIVCLPNRVTVTVSGEGKLISG